MGVLVHHTDAPRCLGLGMGRCGISDSRSSMRVWASGSKQASLKE